MTFEPVWGAIIAWYLFLAGVGGGAFITSAFLGWKFPAAVRMRRAGRVIAPVVVIIGLVLLMFDAEAGLHNPLRFVLLLTNFGSVMTWGVVFLSLFVVVALVAAGLELAKRSVPRWLDIIGVVLGVCVAMYTGALLGVCRTFPLWNTALLPVLFLVSALSAGAAAVLLTGAIAWADEFDQVELLKKVHYPLPIIELVLLASLLFITSNNSVAGWDSVARLVSGDLAVAFWVGLVAVGLVIPTALETWLLFGASERIERSRAGRLTSAGAGAATLIGGFLLRLLIVTAALPVTLVVPMM